MNKSNKKIIYKVTEFRLKLYVKDFDKEREFYEILLAFPIINSWDRGENDKGIMFDTGKGIIELLSPESEHKSFAGVDLSLEVDDVNKLWESLHDKANIIFPLTDNAWGDTSFCISDPEGFNITFFTKI